MRQLTMTEDQLTMTNLRITCHLITVIEACEFNLFDLACIFFWFEFEQIFTRM